VFDCQEAVGRYCHEPGAEGEADLALDGKTYTLDPKVSVIATTRPCTAWRGMGGEAYGVREERRSVPRGRLIPAPRHRRLRRKLIASCPTRAYRTKRASTRNPAGGARGGNAPVYLELCGGETREIVSDGVMPKLAPRAVTLCATTGREDADGDRRSRPGERHEIRAARLHVEGRRSWTGGGAALALT